MIEGTSLGFYLITKWLRSVRLSRLTVEAVVIRNNEVRGKIIGREEAVAGPVDVRGPAVDGRSLVRIFEEPLTGDRGLRGRAEVEDGWVVGGRGRGKAEDTVFV